MQLTAIAVVVTNGHTRYLAQTLTNLTRQSVKPTRALVVDVSKAGSAADLISEYPVTYVPAPGAANLAAALAVALPAETPNLSAEGESQTWYWILHDDSAPETGCLEQLLRTADSAPSIALVGPKVKDWFAPDRLLEIGIHAARSGRRYEVIRGDLDQGQHDLIEDVIAVSTAGMLVNSRIWHELGGLDPALGVFGAGLEFGRRVHLAGHRVVAAPAAEIYHAEATFRDLRRANASEAAKIELLVGDREPYESDLENTFAARRAAQIYNWLAAARPWFLPLLLVILPLWQIGRALVRLATLQPRLALSEISALGSVLIAPRALVTARQRIRSAKSVPYDSLHRLEIHPHKITAWLRLNRKVARNLAVPTQALEPVAAVSLKRRREHARMGALALLAAALGLTLIHFAPLVRGWHGAASLGLPDSFSALWSYAFSSWIPSALGAAGAPDPLLVMLALLCAPFALLGISPDTALQVLVIGAPVLTALGAWKAAGTLCRSITLRIYAAVAWLSLPAYWFSLISGKLSVIVFCAAAPWVLYGALRAAHLHQPETILGARGNIQVRNLGQANRYYGISALALCFVVAAAPALTLGLPIVVLAFLRAARAHRWRALLVPVPALILNSAFLYHAYRQGALLALLGSADATLPESPASAVDLAFGFPAAVDLLQARNWPLLAVSALIIALAVLACLRLRTWRQLAPAGAIIFATCTWVLALWISRQVVAAGRVEVYASPAIYLLIAYGSLIAGTAVGLEGWLRFTRPQRRHTRVLWRGGKILVALGTVALILTPAALAYFAPQGEHSAAVLTGTGQYTSASGKLLAQSEQRAKTLRLQLEEEGELSLEILRFARPTYLEHSALLDLLDLRTYRAGQIPGRYSQTFLAAVAGLSQGAQNQQTIAPLVQAGIGQIIVAPGSGAAHEQLVKNLKANPDLESLGQGPAGELWRLSAPAYVTESGVVATAAWWQTQPQMIPPPANRRQLHANTLDATGEVPAPGTVFLAENPHPLWIATQNRTNLPPLPAGESQIAAYSAEAAGPVKISWSDPGQELWKMGVLGVLLINLSAILFSKPRRRW